MKKKNPWKRFIAIVTALVIVMLGCVTTNVIVDSISKSIVINKVVSDNSGNTGNNGDVNSYVPNNGNNGGLQGNGDVNGTPDNNGGVPVAPNAGQQGGANQQGGTNTQTGASPLNYNKAQLVDYYNACLKKSYTYKLNASKTEQVDVSVSGIDIGNLNMDVDKFAQNIIANNTKKNGVVQTKSFVNGKATDDGSAVQQFILPTNLYADAVQSISIVQNGQGYKMVIKLKAETCAHDGTAKYNASCTWPLDVGVIDFGQAVTIQSCTFSYPGTVLTAMIDGQGRVYAVKTEMPLNVANAQAKAVGITIKVGSISGKWTCVNELKFLG